MKTVIFSHYAGPHDGHTIEVQCEEFTDIHEQKFSEFRSSQHGHHFYQRLPDVTVEDMNVQVRFYKWCARPPSQETFTTGHE